MFPIRFRFQPLHPVRQSLGNRGQWPRLNRRPGPGGGGRGQRGRKWQCQNCHPCGSDDVEIISLLRKHRGRGSEGIHVAPQVGVNIFLVLRCIRSMEDLNCPVPGQNVNQTSWEIWEASQAVNSKESGFKKVSITILSPT